jgi:hypothetical protein
MIRIRIEKKLSKKELAQTRAKLMHDEVVFDYLGTQFKTNKSEFDNMDPIYSIANHDLHSHLQMNVNKFGPTCVTVYTYDMLGNRTSGKIKYKEIKFVKEEA